MLSKTTCFAFLLLLSPAARAADAPAANQLNTMTIGTEVYRLPQGWVNWAGDKCPDQSKCSFHQNHQNWLECVSPDPTICPKAAPAADKVEAIADSCNESATAQCRDYLKTQYGLVLPSQPGISGEKLAEAYYANQNPITTPAPGNTLRAMSLGVRSPLGGSQQPPANNGNNDSSPTGQTQSYTPYTPYTPYTSGGGMGLTMNPSGLGMNPGGPSGLGGGQGDSSLAYLREGFSGGQGMGGTIDGIVKESRFLNDHASFYLANNTSPTNMHALQTVGANVLKPISQQIMGDETSGRSAFDGQSANLKKDVERRCGTNFFGLQNCPNAN